MSGDDLQLNVIVEDAPEPTAGGGPSTGGGGDSRSGVKDFPDGFSFDARSDYARNRTRQSLDGSIRPEGRTLDRPVVARATTGPLDWLADR